MKKVCLRFETILRVFEFLDLAAVGKYRLDRISNILIADLSDADIELAERCFHAKVVRMQLA